jgi:hypothetical protein
MAINPDFADVEPAQGASDATVLPPLRSRYLLAALLVLVALVTFVLWSFLAMAAIDATADNYLRGDLPGELTSDFHPGTWNVYAEGPVTVTGITVTDAEGTAVTVTTGDGSDMDYDRWGSSATLAGSFDVPRGGMSGEMRIKVTGSAESGGEATFAVSADDELDYLRLQHWGMVALLAVNLGAAVAIIITPIIRRRRHTSTLPHA